MVFSHYNVNATVIRLPLRPWSDSHAHKNVACCVHDVNIDATHVSVRLSILKMLCNRSCQIYDQVIPRIRSWQVPPPTAQNGDVCHISTALKSDEMRHDWGSLAKRQICIRSRITNERGRGLIGKSRICAVWTVIKNSDVCQIWATFAGCERSLSLSSDILQYFRGGVSQIGQLRCRISFYLYFSPLHQLVDQWTISN